MSSSSAWAPFGADGRPNPNTSPARNNNGSHRNKNKAPNTESMQRTSSSDRPPKKTQTRQLLSCTKCRKRKVKCDRTKPCSACCASGNPRGCEFVVGDGNDYTAIQQSYELRRLRLENQRLTKRLQQARLGHSGDEDDVDSGIASSSARAAGRAALARQRRFRTSDRVDNLYFGTPGLASMVSDFANLQVGSQSLSHPMPRLAPQDVYAPSASMYPFPVMWHGDNSLATLVQLLPALDEILELLDAFQRRAQSCSFPHTPEEVTKQEVERFMADVENNAERFPDMLALLFVTLATGLQVGQYDRNGSQWIDGDADATSRKSDVFLAASMQALRLASFASRPTLLAVQTMAMMGPYLTNSGRFLDAFTLFGLTIRLAHSIGLHRNPQFLDPAPSLRECMARQSIWWWMLHMDQQYSVALGRPLGISGYGDCPPPETLTTNQELRRLGEFIHHLTILARQILSSESMSVAKIDEFTDKLVGLWDTMPATLQFNESWLRQETQLPEWPLEVVSANLFAHVQSYLVLLNRQRVERTQSAVDVSPPGSFSYQASSSRANDLPTHAAVIRGRSLVIVSSVAILKTFLFFHYRNPAVLINWNISQQAFNAAMILLLDAWETDNEQNQWLVNQAFVVFDELNKKHVHRLAGLAVKRISDGLAQLGNRSAEGERQQQMAAAAATRRQQEQNFATPLLTLDTASMADLSGDTVMGNSGMFLLEDAGLQSYQPQAFQPLTWTMAGGSDYNSRLAYPFRPPSPMTVAPNDPPAQVPVAPFPVLAGPLPEPGAPASSVYNAIPQPPTQPSQRRRLSSRQAPYPHVTHPHEQRQRQSSLQYPPPEHHAPPQSPTHGAFQPTFTANNSSMPVAPGAAQHMPPPVQMYQQPPQDALLASRRESHPGGQHPTPFQHTQHLPNSRQQLQHNSHYQHHHHQQQRQQQQQEQDHMLARSARRR